MTRKSKKGLRKKQKRNKLKRETHQDLEPIPTRAHEPDSRVATMDTRVEIKSSVENNVYTYTTAGDEEN